jgi:hypothetical protein
MKDSAAPGEDGIPAEAYKYGGHDVKVFLLQIANQVLDQGEVPQDWKNAIIIPLHKSGDRKVASNYRGISLTSHAGKIVERMILHRLGPHFMAQTDCIPDTQFGFMKDKGVVDALGISRQLATLTVDRARGKLFRCYIDLTKAYDRVNRQLMWELLRRYGVPAIIVSVIQSFHEGAQARVRLNGKYSKPFVLETGLKQGSVLSPTLFNVFLGVIVCAARKKYQSHNVGVPLVANTYFFICSPS